MADGTQKEGASQKEADQQKAVVQALGGSSPTGQGTPPQAPQIASVVVRALLCAALAISGFVGGNVFERTLNELVGWHYGQICHVAESAP